MAPKEGQLKATGRSIHQDAAAAMKGDLVRGLIEAVTNCDDAYGEAGGKIMIEVEHKRGAWKAVVRDRASGMRTAELENKIISMGSRTSGFESGKNVRGNLGRGAKDLAAFGFVTFESIKDNRYSKLILHSSGSYRLEDERKAAQAHRQALGIPRGSGTVVTIEAGANITCPRHGTLIEKLTRHYQLRDIMSHPHREIHLVNLTSGENQKLTYSYPALAVEFQGEVPIEGYPGATANVTIYRNPERFDDPSSDPCRPGGLLVKGRRAIYENTYFKFETSPHAGWFSGVVECAQIDAVATEYDDCLDRDEAPGVDNPRPIITRGRDGLEVGHPFYVALANAVQEPLRKLIAQEEARSREAGSRESERMRRNLDDLGRALTRLIDEDLRELDEEGLPVGPEGTEAPPLRIIPEDAVLYMGEDKTLTVHVRQDLEGEPLSVEIEPGGVVELLSDDFPLAPHRKREDVRVTQIRLRPLLTEQTFVTVTCGEHSAVSLVEVLPEPEIIPVDITPPEKLQFERDRYRVAWGKKKELVIEAPPEIVADFGKELRLSASDSGVALLGGGAVLEFDDELEYFTAKVVVEARTIGAQTVIEARLGDHSAKCQVDVARETGPKLEIKIVDEEAGFRRALVEVGKEGTLIRIMGLHSALKRYLGPPPKFPDQDRGIACALVAEIVATEVTRLILEKKYRSGSTRELGDAAALYADHYKYLSRYLPRCHRALVADGQVG